MKKTITPFTAQLVTFETALSFKEVITRLDAALNKAGSAQILSKIGATTSRQELVDLVNGITNGNDFLYFLEMNHHVWMNVYRETEHPSTVVYTIGNPLIAETFMRYDIRSGYCIPPRLLITDAGRSGTSVVYHLPSSLVANQDNAELMEAIRAVDEKLEQMITRVVDEISH